jgi:hypothetical protein
MNMLKILVFAISIMVAVVTTSPGYGTNEVWMAQPRTNCVSGTNCMTIRVYAPAEYHTKTVEFRMTTNIQDTNSWFMIPDSKIVGKIIKSTNSLATTGQFYVEFNYNTKNSVGGKQFCAVIY